MASLKISVVTPSFNQACFLEQTIESVLSQDYPNLEYIVMDGGSSDGSVDIIRKHSGQIAYWCSEKDDGQADAIGQGFDRATGDILCWLNSDDLFLPGALSTVAAYFERHPDIKTVSGGAYRVDSAGKPFGLKFRAYELGVKATYDRLRFYGQDGVFQQSTFWRRSAYDAVGGVNRNLQYIMDRDLFVRLAQRSRFGRLSCLLAAFRQHDESKTHLCRNVCAAEEKRFDETYGVSKYRSVARQIRYLRYRVPSCLRKVKLLTMRLSGLISLPSLAGQESLPFK